MQKIIIASASRGAGKTFVTVGLMKAAGKGLGYIKPLGNRLVYSRKKLWDYDAALIAKVFKLQMPPEDLTIGFEHAKIKHSYTKDAVKKKVLELSAEASKGKKALIIEAGTDLCHGTSINLDPISLAKYVKGKIVLVVNGDDYDALDDSLFFGSCIKKTGAGFAGVIINNVKDPSGFRDLYLPRIREAGIKVLGIIPYNDALTHYDAGYLADNLFSKTLTGEAGLGKVVENVFVGDVSSTTALKNPSFHKKGNLVITGGDRSDMILAAIETGASCVILTNNIMPHANIILKASHAQVPLLLVPTDTYTTAVRVEHLEHMLTEKDEEKIAALGRMVKKHVKLKEIF